MTNAERAFKINEIMKDQDMTMARLQRKTELHINTIRKLLSGEVSPDTSTILSVAAGLEVEAKDLL